MKIKFNFPTVISVLKPLKKKLTWINLMSFSKLQSTLAEFISELSFLEIITLIHYLTELNKHTRRFKRILLFLMIGFFFSFLFRFIREFQKKSQKNS